MWNKPASQKSNPTPDDYVDPESYGADMPPDQTGIIRPVVQKVEVLPYRGEEYHGVNPNLAGPPPDINHNVWDVTAEVPFPEEKQEPQMQPVPVRIVEQGTKEVKAFRVAQLDITADRRIVERNVNRYKVTVKNLHATMAIYISNVQGQSNQYNGYPIDPGAEKEITTTEPIYASSADGTTTIFVAILDEMSVIVP